MGLAAAYFAARAGFKVDVFEAGDRSGGMAAHFDFGGVSLERFYHFCCKSDHDTMALLSDLGLPPIRWVSTRMGYFTDGKLYPFGDPISLLRFPALSLTEKLRYGVMAFLAVKRRDWTKLDRITAKDWFIAWCGRRAYDKLWQPLFHYKFYEFADRISAAWVWQRIKRLGQSRRSLFEEQLGYIEGGSETLMNALAAAISQLGGTIHLSTPVQAIRAAGGAVQGVETSSGFHPADAVISTAPLPYVPAMLRRDAPEQAKIYEAFDNVGVVCVIHKLRRQVSANFWVNVSDPAFTIPGFVEFSNLRPLEETIVYVPYYMPATNPKFRSTDQAFIEESFAYLQKVNPALRPDDRVDSHVGRLTHAQPVYTTRFLEKLPPAQTAIRGLQIADTSFYYPEDRGISESIGFARRMVMALGEAR